MSESIRSRIAQFYSNVKDAFSPYDENEILFIKALGEGIPNAISESAVKISTEQRAKILSDYPNGFDNDYMTRFQEILAEEDPKTVAAAINGLLPEQLVCVLTKNKNYLGRDSLGQIAYSSFHRPEAAKDAIREITRAFMQTSDGENMMMEMIGKTNAEVTLSALVYEAFAQPTAGLRQLLKTTFDRVRQEISKGLTPH